MIKVKRAYEPPGPADGKRYLVDRLWPRGVKKSALHIEAWLKDVSPTPALIRWFGHDPKKWDEFRRRYRKELDRNRQALDPILKAARRGRITLVYGARDIEHNNALVLKSYAEKKLGAEEE
ncbi:MAG TPA: DUF488 family protein [Candidatus Acidoferrales bacterium]|nr:DUF488 family protein [Candidatus Acidoferrales bacterium]